jgi:hypothetical protein
MATAKTRFIKQVETIRYVYLQDGVELSLTDKEAQTLIDILDFVGGSPTLSRRKFSGSIQIALNAAGYSVPLGGVQDIDYGGLCFADVVVVKI